MTAQEGPKRKTSTAKPDEETRIALGKAKAKAKAAPAQAKAEERARLKAEEGLAEAEEALAAAPAEVEHERQVQVKTEQTEAEPALAEVRQATEIGTEKIELPPAAPEEGGAERRVSFVIRLTVDERGQPRRTEIEHARSGQKGNFPGLDAQRLAAFMQAYLKPLAVPEPATPSVPLPPTAEAPTSQLLEPAVGLAVSDVEVFHPGVPDLMALALNSAEAFVVQVRFELQGPQALALTTQISPFEIRIYAHELTSGASTLLTTYSGNLVENVVEYTTQTQALGLSPGLYRLITLVTLHAPAKMVGHHEGPIVHIAGVRQPAPELLADRA